MWIKKPRNETNKIAKTTTINLDLLCGIMLVEETIEFFAPATNADDPYYVWHFKTDQEAQSEYDEILRRLEVMV